MARNRMIRPEFWEDTKIAKLSPHAKLFYIALWNFADDEGYIQYDLTWLKAKCFPYDKINIEKLIDELISIERLVIKNNIIFIKNFLKYQNINRPYPSGLKVKFTEHSLNVHGTFSEHSSQEVKTKEEEVKTKGACSESVLILGKTPQKLFGQLWEKYPNKDSRLKSESLFVKSVTTEADWQAINQALENYLKMLKIEIWRHPQSGKTWFNNWREWINFNPEDKSNPEDEKMKKLKDMSNCYEGKNDELK